MDDQPLTLELFFGTVERVLQQQLAGLQMVSTWPDIRERVALPAIFLELGEIEPGTDPGTGRVGLDCRMEAYIIVAPELAGHHHRAAQMSTQLAVLLHNQQWDLPDLEVAVFVQAGPDWTKPELDGYTVWKVEWTQMLYLGEEQWPWEDQPGPVVWGIAPEVGREHEGDYVAPDDLEAPA